MTAKIRKRKRLKKNRHVKVAVPKPAHLEGYTNNKQLGHGVAWRAQKKDCWPTCFPCWDAYRKYRKRNVYRRDSGMQAKRVDPEPTRALIRSMVDHRGYSIRKIATFAGVHDNTVRRMYRTDCEIKYTLSTFAEKVQELLDMEKPRGDVWYSNLEDSTLSRNAVRGLMRQGWTQEWIARQTGIDRYAISRISTPAEHTRFIKPENRAKIVELARRIGSEEGGNVRTQNYAIRNKWQPTIMFDELL